MLKVSTISAKPGLVLAMPVYHPRRHDTMLLKAGITLDSRSIQRLQELKLRDLWVRYPGVEFACEYICPAVFEAQASLTWQIGRALDAVSQSAFAALEYGEYRAAVAGTLSRLIANPSAAVFVQELVGREQPLLRHASNVCLVSMLMGLKLDDYLVVERSRLGAQAARDVTSLSVGAMFHDIGMLRLDPAVVQRWNTTQDETDPGWRRHVTVGFELVKDAIGPAAAAGVLHHHQKFDGSGFPRRILRTGGEEVVRGSDIHVFARIIACADLYDRLRWSPGLAGGADGGGAAPLPAVRVLRWMQEEPYRRWIDPMAFKALLAVVPAYPPGMMVTLSNGKTGVVVEWFPDDPCRPTVQLMDEPGQRARSTRVVLRQDPSVYVARAEDENVAPDNFYPQTPGEFDLRLARRALINSAP